MSNYRDIALGQCLGHNLPSMDTPQDTQCTVCGVWSDVCRHYTEDIKQTYSVHCLHSLYIVHSLYRHFLEVTPNNTNSVRDIHKCTTRRLTLSHFIVKQPCESVTQTRPMPVPGDTVTGQPQDSCITTKYQHCW